MYVSGTFLFVHGLGLKGPGRLRAAGGDLFVRFWKDGGMKTPAYQHKETHIYTVHGCTDTRTKAHMHADTNRFYCLPKAFSLSAYTKFLKTGGDTDTRPSTIEHARDHSPSIPGTNLS